ncbi:MAG TPA: anti-sigma factor [Anaerolineales bacterium]|nr:anti-sigma factor [Anaerolineales bacterium]
MENIDPIRELIPAYALDSLDPEEAELVARHLAECPECQLEFASYSELVGSLALAVPMHPAPPELKARILSAAHASAQSMPLPANYPQTSRIAKPARAKSGWANIFQQALPAWGLLSILLIGILAISNLRLNQRIASLEAARPEFATVQLSGADNSPNAVGMLVISPDGQNGSLVVDQMPVLEDNQDYQLWLIKDGQRTSGGVFHSYSNGYGVLWIHADQPLISYEEVGVTIEPAGGSPAPTGAKIIGGLIQN